jgi:hypothetical protein
MDCSKEGETAAEQQGGLCAVVIYVLASTVIGGISEATTVFAAERLRNLICAAKQLYTARPMWPTHLCLACC